MVLSALWGRPVSAQPLPPDAAVPEAESRGAY
jgi:hypothetical protein